MFIGVSLFYTVVVEGLSNPVVVSVTVLHYLCSKVIWSEQLIVSPGIVCTCCVNVWHCVYVLCECVMSYLLKQCFEVLI